MSDCRLSRSRRNIRARPLAAAGLAGAMLLWPGIAMSATPMSPFAAFLGNWRGSGEVTAVGGRQERMTCRGVYSASRSGVLSQSLDCASAHYRLDVRSYVVSQGGVLTGGWQETTRHAAGKLTGHATPGGFEGMVVGPQFSAGVSIRSNGRQQIVSIRPRGGDIANVQVVLSR